MEKARQNIKSRGPRILRKRGKKSLDQPIRKSETNLNEMK